MAVEQQDVAKKISPPFFVEEIDVDEITNHEIVGKGSFGTVYKAKWNNNYVAVKFIEQESEKNAFITEVCQLSRVAHPNIIGLYGACTKRPHVFLVMEYAEGGSLHTALHGRPKPHYKAAHAMSWARQCAEGVAYLHAMSPKALIHRDLKPPNLLLVQQGTVLKICDFGTVTDKSTLMTNNKGSAAWMAPEVFESVKYTEKCDVYSWGIILWEIITREQPFKDFENPFAIMWHMHLGNRPPLIENCPKPIEKLIVLSWSQDPNERPPMDEVVKIMTELCKFFPGAEEPIVYEKSPEDDVDSYLEDDEIMDTNARTSNTSNHSTVYGFSERFSSLKSSPNESLGNIYQKNSRSVIGSNRHNMINRASKLPPNYAPLNIEIGPDTWQTLEDYDLQPQTNNQGNEKITLKRTVGPIDPSAQQNNTTAGSCSRQNAEHTNTNSDSSLDIKSLNNMLDEHLRPITPVPNNPLSEKIYGEHKHLVQEYFEVQTQIGYCSNHKKNLLDSMTPEQRSVKLEYLKKLEEKESLLKLKASLKQQLELRNAQQQSRTASSPATHTPTTQPSAPPPHPASVNRQVPGPEGGWVIVPHTKSDNRKIN